jgi:hypothetical protein
MRQALHSSLALVSKNVFAQKWRKGSTTELQTETQTMKSHVYYLLYKFLRQKVCDAQDLVQYRFVHVRSDSKASGAASGQGTGASHTMAACSKSEVWSIPHTWLLDFWLKKQQAAQKNKQGKLCFWDGYARRQFATLNEWHVVEDQTKVFQMIARSPLHFFFLRAFFRMRSSSPCWLFYTGQSPDVL